MEIVLKFRILLFALIILATFGTGMAVGYTVGTGDRLPMYIVAGVAGIIIVSTTAYFVYYKKSRQDRVVPIDSRESSRVNSSAESSLPLFSLSAFSFPSPH